MLLHVTNEPIDRSHLEPENAVCHEDLLGKAIIEQVHALCDDDF